MQSANLRLASPQSVSLHLHPYYYPEFPSPYPSHLPLRGTTSPPHLQRTLGFHSPPRLTVYAGRSFSSTISRFPGLGSRGAELRSNFLGSTRSRHKRTAIGGFTGAGLRREKSGCQPEMIVSWTKGHFPKILHGLGGYSEVAGGAASARWRVPERLLLTASQTRGELSNQCGLGAPPLPPPPGFQPLRLGLLAGYLQTPPNRPTLQHRRHKNSSFSIRPLL